MIWSHADFLPKIPFLLGLGIGLAGCGQTEKEQRLIRDLNQELKTVRATRSEELETWLRWYNKSSCYHLGPNKRQIAVSRLGFRHVSRIENKLNALQIALNARYQNQPFSRVNLTDAEIKEAQAIKSRIDSLPRQLVSFDYETVRLAGLLKAKTEAPDGAPKWEQATWAEYFIQDKPAGLALLHLQVLKEILRETDENLWQQFSIHFSHPIICGKIYLNVVFPNDPLSHGANKKAMVYLGGKQFPCELYPYPKAFFFNGQPVPFTQYPGTSELVAQINNSNQKLLKPGSDAAPDTWTGKWVIALSAEKDTIIEIKGRLPVLRN